HGRTHYAQSSHTLREELSNYSTQDVYSVFHSNGQSSSMEIPD
ncbi:unnamed protein product, partial [Rotaria sp. Silwood2]